jgi:hypothetical protein
MLSKLWLSIKKPEVLFFTLIITDMKSNFSKTENSICAYSYSIDYEKKCIVSTIRSNSGFLGEGFSIKSQFSLIFICADRMLRELDRSIFTLKEVAFYLGCRESFISESIHCGKLKTTVMDGRNFIQLIDLFSLWNLELPEGGDHENL